MRLLLLALAILLLGIALIVIAEVNVEFFGFFILGPFPIIISGGEVGSALIILLLIIFLGLLWLFLRR